MFPADCSYLENQCVVWVRDLSAAARTNLFAAAGGTGGVGTPAIHRVEHLAGIAACRASAVSAATSASAA